MKRGEGRQCRACDSELCTESSVVHLMPDLLPRGGTVTEAASPIHFVCQDTDDQNSEPKGVRGSEHTAPRSRPRRESRADEHREN